MQQETSKRCSGKILRRRAAVRRRVFSGLSKIKGRVRGESVGKESQADVKFVGGYGSNKFGKIKEYKKVLRQILRLKFSSLDVKFQRGDDDGVDSDLSNCGNCLGGWMKMMGGCGRVAKHQGIWLQELKKD
ncbi:hypothetical protein GW17_00017352 [Ensete ventricosum]|nr:hypothetical protein GW17_00017352 [Ensete ventricosum]